jgi:hypothetical protein
MNKPLEQFLLECKRNLILRQSNCQLLVGALQKNEFLQHKLKIAI